MALASEDVVAADAALAAPGTSSASRRRRAAIAARLLWAGVFVLVAGVCLWWRLAAAHAEAQRAQAVAQAEREFIANLYGGELGLALLRQPRDASAWRQRGGPGRPAILGPRQHQALVAALTDVRAFDRAHAARPAPVDACVRLEDERGSLTLALAFDSALLEVYINGNRLGQACFAPARARVLTLLREVLAGDPGAQAWH